MSENSGTEALSAGLGLHEAEVDNVLGRVGLLLWVLWLL